jgi:uncharacterized protein
MIIDLLNVGDEPISFDLTVEPDDIDLGSDRARVVGNARVIGHLSHNEARTEVQGDIRVPIEIDCTRCLKPTRREIDTAFRATFVGKELFPQSRETHLESADLDTDVVEGNELDLAAVAREQILLNVPEQAFCREDCRGLCPRCGADLNDGDCGCRDDEMDPRWAALKDLKI